MFKMQVSSLVCSIVDQLLVRNWKYYQRDGNGNFIQPGIKISLDVRIYYRDCKKGTDVNSSTFLNSLFCGNTSVFACVTEHPLTVPKISDWTNVGNHDACWKDAYESYVNALYFNMCEHVTEQLPDKLNIKPVELDQFVRFSFIKPIQYVSITHRADEEKNQKGDTYWREVVCIEDQTNHPYEAGDKNASN